MIEQLASETRKLLVTLRCQAMRGEVDFAIRRIDELLASENNSYSALDRIGLLLLKAEILYLDCREEKALEVFRQEVDPLISTLSQEIKFIVGQNKSDVAMAVIAPGSFREADRLYDQRKLAGLQLWDSQAMVYAYEAATDGRHYDALPAIWREFTKSYRQGIWRYQRLSARRMALEFLQIGWAHSAEYHAVIAQDVKVAEKIGSTSLPGDSLNTLRGL